jgi:acyl-CoA thioester hydrolase
MASALISPEIDNEIAMLEHKTIVRVNYGDTDQMGFVHHSNYAKYCETARWEALRAHGLCYKELEDIGILMPVISMKFNFIKPAFYDELLTVKTTVRNPPRARMLFEFEISNESGVLINTSEVCMAFIKKDTLRPCFPPEYFLSTLNESFHQLIQLT